MSLLLAHYSFVELFSRFVHIRQDILTSLIAPRSLNSLNFIFVSVFKVLLSKLNSINFIFEPFLGTQDLEFSFPENKDASPIIID